MTTITVKPGNTHFSTDDGVLYDAAFKTVLACPVAKTGSYSLHANTEVIAEKAFMSTKLSSLNLKTATNLKNIDRFALRWVLLISFVRFRGYFRDQSVSEGGSNAGIVTE